MTKKFNIDPEFYSAYYLSEKKKYILTQIKRLDKRNGCFKSTREFAKELKTTETYVRQIFSELYKAKLIYCCGFNGKISWRKLTANYATILEQMEEEFMSPKDQKHTPQHTAKHTPDEQLTHTQTYDSEPKNEHENIHLYNKESNKVVESNKVEKGEKVVEIKMKKSEATTAAEEIRDLIKFVGLNEDSMLAHKIFNTIFNFTPKEKQLSYLKFIREVKSKEKGFEKHKINPSAYERWWFNDFLVWEEQQKQGINPQGDPAFTSKAPLIVDFEAKKREEEIESVRSWGKRQNWTEERIQESLKKLNLA